jgi:hypothetical protein
MSEIRGNPYTQRAIKGRIKAALEAGLKVVAILPDGTVCTEDRPVTVLLMGETAAAGPALRLTHQPKLRDARELLR